MIIGAVCLVVFLGSCTKDHETGTMTVRFANQQVEEPGIGQMQVRSTRALDAIFLDVRSCEMHYNDGSPNNWVILSTNAGIYNLYDLNDDATVVLVNELTMPAGEVGQMRLILGPNNSIVIDGVAYPLKVPSGEQSGLKIDLHDNIHFHHYVTVVLDFDPNHQIVELGNGGYILKPVMHVDVIYQD